MSSTLATTLRQWGKSRHPRSTGAALAIAAADEIESLQAEVKKLQKERGWWKAPANLNTEIQSRGAQVSDATEPSK